MTQENKFALVIGFALLLVVGILVSDHLAEVTRGQPANLAVKADPMAGHQPSRVEFQPLLVTRGIETPPTPGQPEGATSPVADLPLHAVAAGETMHAIARMHYGRDDLMPLLAAYNHIPNPARLKQGVRLMIPSVEVLVAGRHGTAPEITAAPTEAPTATATSVTYSLYVVRSGDTLSEIAQQVMGSMRHMDELLQLNQEVLMHPDALQPGMKLRYPRHVAATTP